MPTQLLTHGPMWGQEIETCPDPLCRSRVVNARPVNLPHFRERYWVTSTGKIFSVKRRIWSALDEDGEYLRATFFPRVDQWHIVVHRLVAITFPDKIPEWNGSPILDVKIHTIDHHDSNKRHNCVSNLRVIAGGQTELGYAKGERKSKLAAFKSDILFLDSLCHSAKSIARKYGASETAIRNRLKEWKNT